MAYAVFAGDTVAGTEGKAQYAAASDGDSHTVLYGLLGFYLSLYSFRAVFGGACSDILCVAIRSIWTVFGT